MKSVLLMVSVLLVGAVAGAGQIPVSVTAFKNKVGSTGCSSDWSYWSENLGSAFQEMLISELIKRPQVEILEREQINAIYEGEHQLVNSEESDVQLQRKKFKKARYTFVGAVSDYEYCGDENSGGIRLPVGGLFGSVGIKFSRKNAKVKIDLRVIDTVSGQVVASVTTEGKTDRHSIGFDAEDLSYENQMRSPVGEAARSAIAQAVAKVENRLR